MTPAQLRTRAYDLAGANTSTSRLSEGTLGDYLHEGMMRLARAARPPHLATSNTQNLTASTAEYVMPLEVVDIITVRALGSRLTYIERPELDAIDGDWESATGSPTHWYWSSIHTTNDGDYGKRKIGLYPTPTANSTNALIANYYRRPHKFSEMSNSGNEVIDIPLQYHDTLAHYAAARFLQGMHEVVENGEKLAAILGVWQSDKEQFAMEMGRDVSRLDRAANNDA